MKNKTQKIINSLEGVTKSQIRLLKAKTERMWIEENKHIHLLNYWFYRYFTNSYRDFLLVHFKWDD